MNTVRVLLPSLFLAMASCGTGSPNDGGVTAAQLVGTWTLHTNGTTAGETLDVIHQFRSDGTVDTTLELHTACSGTTPIPTRTTRTYAVDGIHLQFTIQSPDSCGTYPILACLSDTGIPCTDLPTERMSFSLSGSSLTLTESAHGRENGTYTRQ